MTFDDREVAPGDSRGNGASTPGCRLARGLTRRVGVTTRPAGSPVVGYHQLPRGSSTYLDIGQCEAHGGG
jgi:hypothetical protein